PHGLHFPVSFFVYISDLINLCRNISDGVRPFIPPYSLVSLYALTNISYLNFPSFMLDISSTARNSFFTILLYASTFPCNCGRKDDRLRKFYLRIAKRHGNHIGITNVANKMITIIWHMLVNKKLYNERKQSLYETKLKRIQRT